MLPFIFEDPRHVGAKRASDKLSIAMLIAIEFIWRKLIDAFHWILAAFLLYACILLFYTNALLSYTIFMTERGVAAILELAIAAISVFIFVMFAFLILTYSLSALLRLLPTSDAINKAIVRESGAKSRWNFLVRPLNRATKTISAARAAFNWRSSGRYWKTSLILILSVILYFHHWQSVKSNQAAIRSRDILPQRVMQDSKQVHDFLKPYIDTTISWSYDHAKPWLKTTTTGGR
jgi:hypothetical protein